MRQGPDRRRNVVSIGFLGASLGRSSPPFQASLLVPPPLPGGSHWGREPERWEEPGATVGGGLAPAAFARAGLLPAPGRGRRTNRVELRARSAPRRKMREAARGRRKSAGPPSSPGAWFSSPVGPLAFDRVIVSRSLSPRLQLVSRPRFRSILVRASTRGAPASTPATRPPPRLPPGLSPEAPRLGPGGLPFRAGDRAAEQGQGGGEDTLSPTVAIINFKGVSLRANENTLDAWPEASRPPPEPSALRSRPRRVGLQNEPHFSLVLISPFSRRPSLGAGIAGSGGGGRTHIFFWGGKG